MEHCLVCLSRNLVEPKDSFLLIKREPHSLEVRDGLNVNLIVCTDCGFIAIRTDSIEYNE